MAKILVTDDASFMRMMLRDMLTKQGHQVVEANNGLDMLSKYDIEQPDLVTLDITMPEMDGLQAVKELTRKYPNAKVIMCSAMGQQVMVIEAIQNGAKDFVVKPFQAERVLESVNKVLGNK